MILDASYTLLVACIALLIGMFVVKFTPFLQKTTYQKPSLVALLLQLFC
ncbi:hypothetical protein HMPREF9346_03155 [Escherichia coli MS 119-7]|nr:hypothetical protein HMPREF9346_03155 [Escherichia coli MS 119-7]